MANRRLSLAVFAVLLLACSLMHAQIGTVTTLVFPGAPTGACPNTQTQGLNAATGALSTCPVAGGSWQAAGSGGGITGLNGTANQIDVTGSSTKTVKFDPVAQIGTANSFAPTGSGQTVGSQVWLTPSLVAPAGTGVNSGGTLVPNHNITIAYTFNTAAGQTLLSLSATVVTPVSCSPTCSVTVTAPTIPSGYTGYTVYDCDATASPGCTPIQQAASNNCVNISANCTIATLAAGGSPPTTITAYLQPPNVQTSECPPGVIPSIFEPDNSGNYHTWVGVDPNSNNSQTSGTPTICHRTWFNDTLLTPPAGNNAFVAVAHQPGVGVSHSNQDRAFHVEMDSPAGDTGTYWGWEGVQSQVTMNGAPSFTGSPDSEVSAVSAQTTDQTTTGGASPNQYGINAVRAVAFREPPIPGSGTSGAGWQAYYGVFAQVINAATVAATNGTQMTSLYASMPANSGTATGIRGNGLKIGFPVTAAKMGAINSGIYIPNQSMTVVQGTDWAFENEFATLPFLFNGPTIESAHYNSALGSYLINASANVTGAIETSQATSAAPQNVICSGNPGSSTYGYRFIGVDVNGGTVASSQVSSISVCANPLTSGNPATINVSNSTISSSIQNGEFVRIDVYRTSGPMATGKIGSLTCSAATASFGPLCNVFSDTGLSADGGTAPSTNTTGTLSTAGYAQHSANKFFVTTNFTTAANTSLQTITGLTFNLLPAAANYQFHCALSYSQATANAAVAFGIQAATVNPTNIFAMGGLGTSATAGTSGVLPTLATTTATAIVSATPSATATNFTAVLDGTIEEPANDAGQAINIMVSTATAADAVTVLRGSYCYLY